MTDGVFGVSVRAPLSPETYAKKKGYSSWRCRANRIRARTFDQAYPIAFFVYVSAEIAVLTELDVNLRALRLMKQVGTKPLPTVSPRSSTRKLIN